MYCHITTIFKNIKGNFKVHQSLQVLTNNFFEQLQNASQQK